MQGNNVAFRLLVTGALVLGGFVFFPLFFVAAFVGWSLFQDINASPDPDSDKWFVKRWSVTAADPDWQSCFMPFCESPAEEAFLKAMIAECGLVPDNGNLSSATIKMTLQAKLDPYRVDFLVNDWLVVEVDGAAYHSSDEAVAKDRVRDLDLHERGFRVLRIPAKTVFTIPDQAVRSVRSAMALGKPTRPVTTIKPPAPSVGKVLSSINNFVGDLNNYVSKEVAVQDAMKQSVSTFSTEKTTIDAALEIGSRRKEVQSYRARSVEHAQRFDEAYAEISALFDEPEPVISKPLPMISEPAPHQDQEIDAAIRLAHRRLLDERTAYFENVRRQLALDPQLKPLVKDALKDIGSPDVWNSISD